MSNSECTDAKLRERAIAHNGVPMTKARVTEEPGDRETITPGSVVAVRGATPSPTITQADAAAAAWYRRQNRLCDAARIEADLGKPAARLTRRALDGLVVVLVLLCEYHRRCIPEECLLPFGVKYVE
jgi:hypothetical protein